MGVHLEEARRLTRLAAPVVATQLASMMLGVVDALMVGRIGVEPLAAASLGNVWVMGSLLAAMGIVLGIDPLVSQAHGARDAGRAGLALQQGLVVALLVSVPCVVSLFFTERGLVLLGQEAGLARLAHDYAIAQIPGVAPFLAFIALRQYLQGRAIVTPAMWVALLANGFNAFANWVLIYGNLGAPALGLVGSGVATSLTRVMLVATLAAWIVLRRHHEGAWLGWTRDALRLRGLVTVLRTGVPVALQFSLEVWAFQLSTLFAGRLGAPALAAHSIVLNIASVSFMVPLGISIGTATRVGNLIGAGQPWRAQRSAWVAMAMGGGTMTLFALTFVTLRELLPRAYTSDATVIGLGATLLPVAAAFQLFDGIQVVGGGVLRGMGRTVPAAAFNLIGYWTLALPLAWALAFGLELGVTGIWWGLCLGLGAVAVMMTLWIRLRGPARVDARLR